MIRELEVQRRSAEMARLQEIVSYLLFFFSHAVYSANFPCAFPTKNEN